MYILNLIIEYEGVDLRYFTTEGKAYKALMGSLCPIANQNHPGGMTHWFGFKYQYNTSSDYFWSYRDDGFVTQLKVEA